MNRLFLSGLILITAGVVGALLTFPQYQKFQEQFLLVQEKQREVENREKYFADLRGVQAMLREFPTEIGKIESAIPADPQLPALYEFLQGAAARSELVLRSISSSVGESSEESSLKTIPVALELTGSYDAFKTFVSHIQSASRMMAVQSLGLSLAQESDEFTIKVQLAAYSY